MRLILNIIRESVNKKKPFKFQYPIVKIEPRTTKQIWPSNQIQSIKQNLTPSQASNKSSDQSSSSQQSIVQGSNNKHPSIFQIL